jgi:hypothetical protein
MGSSMKFAYADPPYLGMGKKMYGKLHENAAIWDAVENQRDLIRNLIKDYPDGWAMSCNPKDLQYLLIDPNIRVCAWTKTFHQIRQTTVQYAWEAVLLYGGRVEGKRKPMVRDWVSGVIAMRKGLQGAKPDYFNNWILDLLNAKEGDLMVDMFSGSKSMQKPCDDRGVIYDSPEVYLP